jgi:SAM-dependent methyltransferase
MSPNPEAPTAADPFEAFKAMQRASWANFAPLAMFTVPPAARLVRFAGIQAGQEVLDVGCGTGVVAITAARAGARVTGADLTPELLELAKENAAIAGLTIEWKEADVERLPFADARFDAVVSQFGHIFAPRPEVAVAEMLRVLKPGGRIAFSTWPPDQYVGRMFATTARYSPPPPAGVAPPVLWGDPAIVRERLGAAVRELEFDRDVLLQPSLGPAHTRTLVERTSGPVQRVVQALETSDPAKLAEFRREYEAIAGQYFEGNWMRMNFLMSRALKA